MLSHTTSPFRLPKRTPFRFFESITELVTGLSTLDEHYQCRPDNLSTKEFLSFVLEKLGIGYEVVCGDAETVPKVGSTVIVANHPLGCIEGVVLAELLLNHRSDVKVLANQFLKSVPELSDLFIGIDVFDGAQSTNTNTKALREAHQHLKHGGCLLVFPAGEVSTLSSKRPKLLRDKKWSRSVASLIQRSKASCVPIYIEGRNSKHFYQAGKLHPILRTLMLGRELINKREKVINLKVGSLIKYQEIRNLSDRELVDYLRLNTYLLEDKGELACIKDQNSHEFALDEVIAPIETSLLLKDINSLSAESLLVSSGEYSVYCACAKSIPNLLIEIGRIRETNFREVGEGTGNAVDLDKFDQSYQHLFIWDHKSKAIVGAYRLGLVDEILAQGGIESLYSRSLFQFDHRFINKLSGKAIEVGRSVVSKPYQKSANALLLLWKGIATFAAKNPDYTHLFGPVSISNDYSDQVRQLLTEAMMTHYYDGDLAQQVTSSTPLEIKTSLLESASLRALKDLQLLSRLISRIDQGKTIPVLLKQYLGLNGKLVCFNVDPDFNNALDGLIVVDLRKVEPRTLAKYMGKEQAQNYLTKHSIAQ
ncbi:lysophospholipid acyltransferase family protein [Vibrio maerlii]|uniref:lysophospholipid acyltransferase family protein n=1 Tax=Vibrio maerlii TaxID=2231648 RepID=UPI000E3ED25F|nr:GNAT family N-acyltransferase [Vibrio maerlii]